MEKPIIYNVLKPGNGKNIPLRSYLKVFVHITTKNNPEFTKENYILNLLKDNDKLHLFFLEALLKSTPQSIFTLQFPNGHGITDLEGLFPVVPSKPHEEFLIRIEISEAKLFLNYIPEKIRNLSSKDDRITKSLDFDYFTLYYKMLDRILKETYKQILYDCVVHKGYSNTPEVLSKVTADVTIYWLPVQNVKELLCEDYTVSSTLEKLKTIGTFQFKNTISEDFEDTKAGKYGKFVEICVLGMTKLEEAFFICEFDNQRLLFNIKLHSIENEKYWFECSSDEEREQTALENQQKANEFYLKNNYIASIFRYYNGMRYLEPTLIKSVNGGKLTESFFRKLEQFLYFKLKAFRILDKLDIKEEITRKLEYLFTFKQLENIKNIEKYEQITKIILELKAYKPNDN